MTSTPKEMARHFEQQSQVQREQLDMIRAQQESINTLKQMLTKLLNKKEKPKTKGSSSKGKGHEGEDSLTLKITMVGTPTLRI